ncbi:nuclease-related domain-containing protein [Bacillus sp. JCM 19034]|uniref:nuclease-related domain-containing protein n=1 Tax=Bacillus sp. JCM 19034 TaxID=1481928 RepID=UPI0007826BB8|nr:nuclease-related domain-containing protein [Bacillus sp. JCM 19034]
MAHLIKLKDYTSRYQYDIQRYPSQYTRYKKERWYYLKTEWEQWQFQSDEDKQELAEKTSLQTVYNKLMKIFRVNQNDNHKQERTFEQLKKQYTDELFQIQIKWATSMKEGERKIDEDFEKDEWLRFFTQQIPDSYFLMYHPVFFHKKAEVDLDIVLISPTEIMCITVLNGKEHSIFEARTGRYWFEYVEQTRRQRINPLISLKRMRVVIEERLKEENIAFPIKSIVLCRNGMIDYKLHGLNVTFVDKRDFQKWVEKIQSHPTPIKHSQVQIATLLLGDCVNKNRDENKEVETE